MANAYTVDCACGTALNVTAAAAGTKIPCKSCGVEVGIPGLSELRRSAGQDTYVTNSAERIIAEHNAGREPAGEYCLNCGGVADHLVEIEIVCDEVSIKKERWGLFRWFICFCIVVSGAWVVWLSVILFDIATDRLNKRKHEMRGRYRTCPSQFRICSHCNPNPRDPLSASTVRKLLAGIPLYQQLFQEFPQTKIHVLRTHTGQFPSTP